ADSPERKAGSDSATATTGGDCAERSAPTRLTQRLRRHQSTKPAPTKTIVRIKSAIKVHAVGPRYAMQRRKAVHLAARSLAMPTSTLCHWETHRSGTPSRR